MFVPYQYGCMPLFLMHFPSLLRSQSFRELANVDLREAMDAVNELYENPQSKNIVSNMKKF